ncbi:hypothetical protein OIU34_18800 [Pararhizobium sp. BT-229]|uniref:hypothetical protein n=1 Tax=Pararhizobium sp. BT-229 TaxID=2986923 RepID=UPI0021F69EC2|nr:hypothetical protein [Pararhizobium sp. BT-229]MCV9963930.1 hypothetical protein [Pararhizobium sp. BT-229]
MAIRMAAKKEFTLTSAPFAWGFDNGNRRCIVPTVDDSSLPISGPSRLLLEKLAAVGWDVEGMTVSMSVYDAGERGLFRYVSEVSGAHAGKPFSLRFDRSITGEQWKHIPGAASNFTYGGFEYPSDLRKWSQAEADLFEDIMLAAATRVAKFPPSPFAKNIKGTGDGNIRRLFSTPSIPAPSDFPVLYCWLPSDVVRRRPEGRVLAGHGCRLVVDTMPSDMALLPERYFDAFDYGSTDIRIKADQGTHTVEETSIPVEVRLKHLNEIYVMDMGARDDARHTESILKAGRKQASQEEFCAIQTAAAKTMVPVTEYDGSFRRPVYCIGRHLMDDEARIMAGRVKVAYDGKVVSVSLTDKMTGLHVPLVSNDNAGVGMMHHLIQVGRSVAVHVGHGMEIEPSLLEAIEMREETNRRRFEAQTVASPRP